MTLLEGGVGMVPFTRVMVPFTRVVGMASFTFSREHRMRILARSPDTWRRL
jgi:hypothetical protein